MTGPLRRNQNSQPLTGCSTAGNEKLLLDEALDDAERVVQRSVGLLQHEFVRSPEDERHGAALVRDAAELDALRDADLLLLDQVHAHQVLGVEVVERSNRPAAAWTEDYNLKFHVVKAILD